MPGIAEGGIMKLLKLSGYAAFSNTMLTDVQAAEQGLSSWVRKNNFFNGRLTKLFFLVRPDTVGLTTS